MMEPQRLFEAFVVCGISDETAIPIARSIRNVHDIKFIPSTIQTISGHTSSYQGASKVPLQFPQMCLPAGGRISSMQSHGKEHESHLDSTLVYSVVLTEEDGVRTYASCLSFMDEIPACQVARNPLLLGCVATKAMCLLSKQPCLQYMEQVLEALHYVIFVTGSSVSLPDLLEHVLDLTMCTGLPVETSYDIQSIQGVLTKPMETLRHAEQASETAGDMNGLSGSDVSLTPLLDLLSVDNLLLVFLSVLLERSVLLRCRHFRLLTHVAEGLRQLLFPLQLLHVYVPVLPADLADYVEAPTPFLMGLHSEVSLEGRNLDHVVMVDLDRDHVSGASELQEFVSLLPPLTELHSRLMILVHPALASGDRPCHEDARSDPWVKMARDISELGTNHQRDHFVRQLFLQLMAGLLRDFHSCCSFGEANATTQEAITCLEEGVNNLKSFSSESTSQRHYEGTTNNLQTFRQRRTTSSIIPSLYAALLSSGTRGLPSPPSLQRGLLAAAVLPSAAMASGLASRSNSVSSFASGLRIPIGMPILPSVLCVDGSSATDTITTPLTQADTPAVRMVFDADKFIQMNLEAHSELLPLQRMLCQTLAAFAFVEEYGHLSDPYCWYHHLAVDHETNAGCCNLLPAGRQGCGRQKTAASMTSSHQFLRLVSFLSRPLSPSRRHPPGAAGGDFMTKHEGSTLQSNVSRSVPYRSFPDTLCPKDSLWWPVLTAGNSNAFAGDGASSAIGMAVQIVSQGRGFVTPSSTSCSFAVGCGGAGSTAGSTARVHETTPHAAAVSNKASSGLLMLLLSDWKKQHCSQNSVNKQRSSGNRRSSLGDVPPSTQKQSPFKHRHTLSSTETIASRSPGNNDPINSRVATTSPTASQSVWRDESCVHIQWATSCSNTAGLTRASGKEALSAVASVLALAGRRDTAALGAPHQIVGAASLVDASTSVHIKHIDDQVGSPSGQLRMMMGTSAEGNKHDGACCSTRRGMSDSEAAFQFRQAQALTTVLSWDSRQQQHRQLASEAGVVMSCHSELDLEEACGILKTQIGGNASTSLLNQLRNHLDSISRHSSSAPSAGGGSEGIVTAAVSTAAAGTALPISKDAEGSRVVVPTSSPHQFKQPCWELSRPTFLAVVAMLTSMLEASLQQGQWSVLQDVLQIAMKVQQKTLESMSSAPCSQEKQFNSCCSAARLHPAASSVGAHECRRHAPDGINGYRTANNDITSSRLPNPVSRSYCSGLHSAASATRHKACFLGRDPCCQLGRLNALHCMGHCTPYLQSAWFWLGVIALPVQSVLSHFHYCVNPEAAANQQITVPSAPVTPTKASSPAVKYVNLVKNTSFKTGGTIVDLMKQSDDGEVLGSCLSVDQQPSSEQLPLSSASDKSDMHQESSSCVLKAAARSRAHVLVQVMASRLGKVARQMMAAGLDEGKIHWLLMHVTMDLTHGVLSQGYLKQLGLHLRTVIAQVASSRGRSTLSAEQANRNDHRPKRPEDGLSRHAALRQQVNSAGGPRLHPENTVGICLKELAQPGPACNEAEEIGGKTTAAAAAGFVSPVAQQRVRSSLRSCYSLPSTPASRHPVEAASSSSPSAPPLIIMRGTERAPLRPGRAAEGNSKTLPRTTPLNFFNSSSAARSTSRPSSGHFQKSRPERTHYEKTVCPALPPHDSPIVISAQQGSRACPHPSGKPAWVDETQSRIEARRAERAALEASKDRLRAEKTLLRQQRREATKPLLDTLRFGQSSARHLIEGEGAHHQAKRAGGSRVIQDVVSRSLAFLPVASSCCGRLGSVSKVEGSVGRQGNKDFHCGGLMTVDADYYDQRYEKDQGRVAASGGSSLMTASSASSSSCGSFVEGVSSTPGVAVSAVCAGRGWAVAAAGDAGVRVCRLTEAGSLEMSSPISLSASCRGPTVMAAASVSNKVVVASSSSFDNNHSLLEGKSSSLGDDCALSLLDLGHERVESRLMMSGSSSSGRVTQLYFSPTGSMLVSGCTRGTLRLWDTRDGGTVRSKSPTITILPGTCGSTTALELQAASMQMYSATSDGVVRLWDLRSTQRPLKILQGHTDAVIAMRVVTCAMTPGNGSSHTADDSSQAVSRPWLVTASRDWTVRVWNPEQQEGTDETDRPSKNCFPSTCSTLSTSGSAAIMCHGPLLGGGCHEVLPDRGSSNCLVAAPPASSAMIIGAHSAPLTSMHVLWRGPRGQSVPMLATGAEDGSVGVWDLAKGHCLALETVHKMAVMTVSGCGGGGLLTGSQDGSASLLKKFGETTQQREVSSLDSVSVVKSGHISTCGTVDDTTHTVWLGGHDGVLRAWRACTAEY
ncbi:hypothetical protein CEUSTIGMA_g4593.t1 [Chlamydomonas eustigma]|uniref:UDENN domain-containing protein n=1 Tax=Chlamydomonas eustigma TaxID=1157962 RepID=A0A250X241_9CHLO|nr:hypothetical protein CEUSTIGMA_g4593.t1 [Chlamydomonas eustigma]|eukprot:GAX77147.1 hypothetical protein CEUSTIGMA_g4593.t1 [Chlamydomonas eustigma]